MHITLSARKPQELSGQVLAVPVWEGKELSSQLTWSSDELRQYVATVAQEEKFEGAADKALFVPVSSQVPYQRLLLVGMGNKQEFTPDRARRFGAWTVRYAEKIDAATIVCDLRGFASAQMSELTHALVEGLELGGYKFLKYKGAENLAKMKPWQVREAVLCGVEKKSQKSAAEAVRTGQLYAQATALARDLINEPAGDMTPERLLKQAQQIAKKNPNITLKYFNREQARKMGMNAFLAIASGSAKEPYFVHLTYTPKPAKNAKTIALVGKGITFDSGGLSLKPSDAMFDMKIDMSGAANVLSVFSVLSELKPNVHVEGIFAACENMPSGSAVKPGDVAQAMNGKTIEILNTDAEGRVCLADALSYAERLKPELIIDFATLTGACMVALGEDISGAFTNDKKFLTKFTEAGYAEGELFWELPLFMDYKRKIESALADVKNMGDNRYAGAITAALMLVEFVGTTPWIHLDIAGPAAVSSPSHPVSYLSRGATGVGVRTFLRFLQEQF